MQVCIPACLYTHAHNNQTDLFNLQSSHIDKQQAPTDTHAHTHTHTHTHAHTHLHLPNTYVTHTLHRHTRPPPHTTHTLYLEVLYDASLRE